MMKKLFWLSVLFLAGCTVAQPFNKKEDAEKNAQDKAIHEISSERVSFSRIHPKSPQHNGYIEWKLYESKETGKRHWRVNDRELSSDAVSDLENLLVSAEKNLVPSDGIYACRYRADMPQYRLNFSRGGHEYSIVSASDCLHGAPFNVLRDGAFFVQLGPEIGTALERALESAGMKLRIGGNAAMMMINQPTALDGYDGKAQKSPLVHYDSMFRADTTFSNRLAVLETSGRLPLPAVACNQAKDPSCTEVSARYAADIGGAVYSIPIRYEGGSVKISSDMPEREDLESLKKAAASPVYRMYSGMDPQPVMLKYDSEADCRMIRGLARHMDAPQMASCSAWRLSGNGRPAMVYYEGLGAFWISSAGSESFFRSLCAQEGLPSASKQILCAEKVPVSKGINVFLKLDGRAFVFETKDGKTTIL